ncbi:MAG: SDR family NAD(P)-dependent oxidoreductase [Bacteroidales bacterium]|nr:SDR family NAD(P)-dependent oxidoreductase [Bacteroidales bacterium]
MRRNLQGRVVLVTGASRGIGRRIAERLGAVGARVAVTSRTTDELDQLAADLRARGAEVAVFPADLTDPASRAKLVADVVAHFGGLDVLVNAAGVSSFGEFATSTPEILRQVTEINFFAAAEMIRLCQPHLSASYVRGPTSWRPAVLNLASLCGRVGIPSLPEHCGSKHALVGLTEALRAEFQRFHIDVLLVLPGVVRSDDLNRHLLRNEGKIYLNFAGAQRPEAVADAIIRSLQQNTTERAVGFVCFWVWLCKRLFPRVVRWGMHLKARRGARRAGET